MQATHMHMDMLLNKTVLKNIYIWIISRDPVPLKLMMKNVFSLLLAVGEQPTTQLQAYPSVQDRLRSRGLYGPLYQVE